MLEPRPSAKRLVQAILRAEAEREGSADEASVVQRVVARLHRELGKLIGPAGFDVLLARSLVLARRADPVLLAGVTAGSNGVLAGLDDVAGREAAAQEGETAIVCHFIELLIKLIGEDLVLHLVVNVWPTAAEEAEK